jgi:MarR family transcriptional regulator, organic hydroperoxide resistance regulator
MARPNLRPASGERPASQTSLGYLLRDTSRVLLRAVQDHSTLCGITLNQHFILRELWRTDGLTVRQLAQRLRLVDPTMTTTISALEKKKLVKRSGSSEDRRRVHVYLTPAGKALHADLAHGTDEISAAAFEGVSDTDRARLRRMLERIRGNMERYTHADGEDA